MGSLLLLTNITDDPNVYIFGIYLSIPVYIYVFIHLFIYVFTYFLVIVIV